jgi:glycosyltransferase involved in cell wall biosynthesis
MGEEAHRIDSKRPLTCIEAPIWDGEGIAAQLEGIFPTVLSLHTSLGIWLQTHADKAADAAYMRDFGHPMLGVERHLLRHSPGVHANSQAIVKMMSDVYDIALAPPRCQVIHHGLLDPSLLPRTEHPRPPGLRLLFVGRLEERKGIDVLMHAFAGLLRAFPDASLDVVGDADVPWFGPSKFHDVYRNWPIAAAIGPRAIFHGKVPDEALRGFLAQADAVVVPSRFESFGLIALEAFAFARPVIAARAGGLAEVVAHGTTGLLVEPGDVGSLLAALMHIAGDAALRDRLGRAGRVAFDAEFSSTRMATQLAAFLSSLQRTRVPPHDVQIAAGSARSAHLWADQQGLLLTPGSVLELPPRGGTLFLTFWRHPWSGCVRVRAGGHEVLADLHAATSGLHTLQIDNIGPGHAVQIERAGMRSEAAQGDEVIFYRASWREAAAAADAAAEPATKPPQAGRRPRRTAAALAIGGSLARKC